jgi:hypothetical protein
VNDEGILTCLGDIGDFRQEVKQVCAQVKLVRDFVELKQPGVVQKVFVWIRESVPLFRKVHNCRAEQFVFVNIQRRRVERADSKVAQAF